MSKLSASIKFFLSFFKTQWTFEDYPLETWINKNAEHDDIKFGAKLTNWHSLIAFGSSRSEATAALKINFSKRIINEKLPRPGSTVNFQFAESDRISKYDHIAVDFFDKIIGINYYSCFISDMTTLYDFDLGNSETITKIKDTYRVSPVGDLFLVDIFDEIDKLT